MDLQINSITELKEFVLKSNLALQHKIEITSRCLNIVLLETIETQSQLINVINENSQNDYRKILLGNGAKPLTNDN